ncbi:glycosyltransferase family 2 protein [Pediococcus pentosaceus]|uniref:glycosyltransferase family 2 protein n=1 Tax=Pediococcus pentosaceus TaxID=1255 RepID=UPI001109928E|nr:glycosyltransferase family 2 protein [Pediococcus pentosaceus]KAF0421987.1 glycosyltransferase [Pediococcus pentosaceus]MBF7131652.1 glycosyltransferase family 2 protein [Pediococcus pentosaceus]TLQ02423.1 glycosyltransferase family 2 protein [Pediococcus pentosaceus]
MVKISIVIPAHNVETFIKSTLNSIKKQSYDNFEVIIVNDNSTDNTEKVVRDFCDQDNRFKLINFPENKGVSEARNAGIRHSTGDFVFFIDGDDCIMNTCLSNVVAKIEEGIDAVLINYQLADSDGNSIDLKKLRFFEEQFPTQNVSGKEAVKLLFSHKISHWSFETIVRRTVLERNNILFPSGRAYGEDFATIYKELFYSRKVAFLDEKLYVYVQRGSSAMHNHRLQDSENYYSGILELNEFVKKNIPSLEREKSFYILPRLINAYSIQCKFPNKQNINFMSKLRNEILKNTKILKNTEFHLSRRDRLKISLIKYRLLKYIYLLNFYRHKGKESK